MTRRNIFILTGSLIVCIGIIIVLVWVFGRNTAEETPDTQTNTNTQTGTQQNEFPTVNATPINGAGTPEEQEQTTENESDKETVLRLSRVIIERYGSYSNRNNFENITSLEAFMTESFKAASLEEIDTSQQATEEEFYGISTSVVSLELVTFVEEDSATVHVVTRRVETRTNQDPTSFNQGATLTFEYVDGNWKVSSITWE